jgi:hypothetical protein
MSQSGDRDTDEQTQHSRKRALRQRAQDFIREDRGRQLKRGQNDRRVKAKAAETRVREAIKAERRREKRRKQIVYIVLREDSDECAQDEDSEENLVEDTDRNSCFTQSCWVVLFLVSNLLVIQFFVTSRD